MQLINFNHPFVDIGGEGVAQGWACQTPGQDTTVQEAMTLRCVLSKTLTYQCASLYQGIQLGICELSGKLYKMLQVKYSKTTCTSFWQIYYYFKVIHQGHLTSGIMPGSSSVPIIVYVLPVPVCRQNVDKYQPMTELETSSQLFNLQ